MTTSSTESAALSIPDLTDQRTFAEEIPHAAFARMRELPGLYWQPTTFSTTNGGFWAVTRYADIDALEKDVETFTSTRGAAYPVMSSGPIEFDNKDGLMLNDPPEHTRLRRAAAKGFSNSVVVNFRPWITEIVREQIDRVTGQDEFDAVKEFAETIPAYVIARVMGVPREDRPRMVAWVRAIFAATQQTAGLAEDDSALANMVPLLAEVGAYAAQIQEIKRTHPADDMFTALTGCVERGEITQNEFLQWIFTMMAAGYETTHTTIAHAVRMYLEDPEVREATDRALDEGTTDRAINEYVRLITPVMQMGRTATRDVEFAGEQIRENDVMVLYYSAANRDPAVFAEPDRFNPWRTEKGHLAFGTGVHRCIGLSLAKLEVQILFEELRSAGLHLRLNGTPRRGWSNFINQLIELPVAQG